MPPHVGRHRAVATALVGIAVVGSIASGCGAGGPRGKTPPASGVASENGGLELHESGGRPRIVIVRREGDPQPAIAIELRIADGTEAAGARTAALAALVSSRLERLGVAGVQPIAGAQYARVRGLVPQLGAQLATALDDALRVPVAPVDPAIPAIQKALERFAARAVDEPGLARAARCLDRPTRPPTFQPIAAASLASTVETWRQQAMRADSIVLGVVGGGGGLDTFLAAWSALSPIGGPPTSPPPPKPIAPTNAFVALTTQSNESAVLVVEGTPRAAIPSVLAALVDPTAPLTLRLRGADEWQATGISGAARSEGGCLVVELEPSPRARMTGKEWNADRVTMRAAVALEVTRQEIERAIERAKATTDGEAARLSIASGGDAREAADRAAWWGWSSTFTAGTALRSTFTLMVPPPVATKGATAATVDVEGFLAGLRPKLDGALDRAKLAWARTEIDLRSRVEPGQGELWAVLGSSCGVAHETGVDAGLGNLAMSALTTTAAPRAQSDGVAIEAWAAPLGLGIVAHAAARPAETPKALAQRVGDEAARAFLATFPGNGEVASARAEALVSLAGAKPPGDLVHEALRASSPERPSWLSALGAVDPVARTGLDSLELRLATLRASPLRLAVIANTDGEQVEVTLRAADRWTPRRPGESRVCPSIDAGVQPKGAIHPLVVKSGTGVAFAFAVDDAQRDAAELLARVLDGAGGRLATDVASAGLGTFYEARFVRGLGRSALVLVALAPDANIDALVQRMRALFEQLRTGGLKAEDLARAERESAAALTLRRLEPRARVVDLFLGDLAPTASAVDLARLRTVATKVLDEDRAHLVVAHLK